MELKNLVSIIGKDGRLVTKTITGGPHVIDKSRGEMERYVKSLKNKDSYVCTIGEEQTQQRAKTTQWEQEVIAFDDNDLRGKQYPYTNPMVILAMLGLAKVHRISVDNGSSVNIPFKDAFDKMRLFMEDVTPCNQWLHGFVGEGAMPLGRFNLFVKIGTHPRSAMRKQTFVLVDGFSAYNAFLGCPTLSDFRAIMAPWCLTMKFSMASGIRVMEGVGTGPGRSGSYG